MATSRSAELRPQIHMIDEEADTLAGLALSIEHKAPMVSELLLREIDRARLHPARSIPQGVVTMGSSVEFRDEGSDALRSVTLVYPHEADIALGRISILTPVGAGLIGLREGQSILWPDRDGHERRLVIVRVTRAAA